MSATDSQNPLKTKIAELAHELNNKLATILMYAEMAKGREKPPPQANLEAMLKAVEQAADLNREILDLTQ